jgi:beta-lactamase class D
MPCCTFTLMLSVMGYDAKVLTDEKTPKWDFKEGYSDYIKTWRSSQTPQSWIKTSCVWYSENVAKELGLEKIRGYLKTFEYGNQEMSYSQDVTQKPASMWLWDSSLKISPLEQVRFIQKLVLAKLPVSTLAIKTTKSLHFVEKLPGGLKLFGKSGLDAISAEEGEIGWYVGWIEKGQKSFSFAYNIRDKNVDAAKRLPRVKQLLEEAGVYVPVGGFESNAVRILSSSSLGMKGLRINKTLSARTSGSTSE